MIGELLVNFDQNVNHKCMLKKNLVALFTSNTTEHSRVTYIKGKLRFYTCLVSEDRISCQAGEVKSAVDFFSPYIYMITILA